MYRIYFLREGTHTDSGNESETYTTKDLEEIRDSYDPSTFKAPIVLGHNEDIKALYTDDSSPAYGWVEKLGVDNKGLYADVSLVKEFENILEREVPPYKYVSAAIYEPENSFNPVKGKKYIRHIAFLGGTPPAIKGLPEVVKMYSESNLVNTMTVFNINNNIKKIEKNMKKYMVEDFDSYEEVVTLPNPETATPDEIKGFLDSNAFDFLVYILTEGEYGYPGEISEFSPEPSEENNYLFDSSNNSFSGIFYDDTSGEVDGFKFEIKKSGEGWTSSYIPVNQTEESVEEEEPTMDNFAEEEEEEEVPLEKGTISTEDESALAQGEIPEDEETVEEEELPVSTDSEIELLRSETKNLRNEILKLKNELNEMKMEEYRAYAEKFNPILENSSISNNQLASLLFELDNVFSKRKLTKAYSEVIKEKPVDVLKKLLDNSLEKLTASKIVTYGEFMPEEAEENSYEEEDNMPIGAVYSDEGLNTHRQVLEYCQKNNLDPKNISQYLEAYKAVCR